MLVLSIDVGIINLGFSYTNITLRKKNPLRSITYEDNIASAISNVQILDYGLVNITRMKHTKVPFKECCLRHDSCIPDYLDHFVQEYSDMFNNAELILIERQPPVGITNVQDLLFIRFREKVQLVSPQSIHKFFSLNENYSVRKLESEQIARMFLERCENPELFEQVIRKHDISDSLLMVIWYFSNNFDLNGYSLFNLQANEFEKFRYSPT